MVLVSVQRESNGDTVPFAQVPIEFAGAGAWEALALASILGSQDSSLAILDEPAVALHPNLQRRLMQYLRRLQPSSFS